MTKFIRYKDKMNKPGYLSRVRYPGLVNFIREVKLGKTNNFIEEYLEFTKEFDRTMVDVLDKAIKEIYDDPIPNYIRRNKNKRCIRECLTFYTDQFNKFIKYTKLNYKSNRNYVISFAIYPGSIEDASKRVNKKLDEGIRLIYEVMWNLDTDSYDIIFTNLNYHYYRNSGYSEI